MTYTSRSYFSKFFGFIFAMALISFQSFGQNKSDIPKESKPDSGKTAQTQDATFPEATGWVNDFEEVIDSATEEKLTKLIVAHNKKTSNQISIVTISSIAPYDYLADYAKDLSNAWGVGEKDKNNGVTIIY